MKHFYAFLVLFLVSSLGFGQTTIWSEDFETDGDSGIRYNSSNTFNDGTNDHFGRTDGSDVSGSYNSQNNTFYWAGEDLDDNGGDGLPTKTITFNAFSINGYTNLNFRGLFASGNNGSGWDDSDILYIEYSIDSAPFQKLIQFASPSSGSNQGMNHDPNLDGIGEGTAITSTFSEFSANISGSGNSLQIRLHAIANSASEEFGFDNFIIEGNLSSTDTVVQFASTSASVNEGDGTYNLDVAITNEDALIATGVEVVLISGDALDIGNYSTQTATFPAASSTNETITITITDDMDFEPNETLTFELQNVGGGNNPSIGTNSTFELTILESDPPSSNSDIIEAGFDEPDNIDYTLYPPVPFLTGNDLTTSNAIKIGSFTIRDGGASGSDIDLLETKVTEIVFNVSGNQNIAQLAIFEGSTNVLETSSVNSSTALITPNPFLNILTAPDNGTLTFDVYATFNTTVTDNEQVQLTVNSVSNSEPLYSTFAQPNAGGAQTSIAGDDNKIEVTANQLTFTQQPSDTYVNEIMADVQVTAIDTNSNIDLDYTNDVDISSNGDLVGDPVTATAVNGVATFNNIIHSSTLSSPLVRLTASDITLAINVVDSNFFEIFEPLTEVQFTSTSVSVAEDAISYDLEFSIINEYSVDTTFDVVLTSGDNADINNYTTQQVTFPANTNANQTLTITITDDAIFEPSETLTFNIQNVSGSANAGTGTNNTFDLTITNNDQPDPTDLDILSPFSNCSATGWTPFDQTGDDSWTCGSGEYAMNGFPGSSDIDWLISDFRIDFDAYNTINIEIETQERFGNTTNESGEFELRYSTDFLIGSDPTLATWTTIPFNPNNSSSGSSLSAPSTEIIDLSGISGIAYLAFFYDMSAGSGAEDWRILNVDITGQVGSSNSDIIEAGFDEPDNIDYSLYPLVPFVTGNDLTTSNAIKIGSFTIRDGGASGSDIDLLETKINELIFSVSGHQNIAQLAIFESGINVIQTDNINNSTSFLNPNINTSIFTASDNGNYTFDVYATFNNTVTDNEQIQLTISSVISEPSYSSFAQPNAGGAQTSIAGDDNKIEVTANQLIFTQQPSNTYVNEIMADVQVTAIDTNSNIDLDYTNDVDISSNGDLVGDPVTATAVNGVATFNNIIHSSTLSSPLVRLTASDITLAINVVDSNFFEIFEPLTEVQFTSTSVSVAEDAISYDLEFSIINEYSVDTTFDVVLTSGDNADINNYTTQQVTFPANTNANQTLTITITDDAIFEPSETLTFNIQNVSGSANAGTGTNNTFDLTILESDVPCILSSAGLSNVSCNNNGTDGNVNDDFITLELNPIGTGLGTTYSVAASGNSVTPSSANYGSSTLFTINNAGGGDFTLTITDNSDNGCTIDVIVTDPGTCSSICNSIFSDDFSGDLSQWSSTGDWTISSGELKHDASGESESYINSDIGNQDLTSGNYEWEFCMRNGSWDPSTSNKFAFFLLSNATNLLFQPDGYAVGMNQSLNDSSDLLRLYSVTNGEFTEIISTSYNWNSSDDVCIKVSRNSIGTWELIYNADGNGEVNAGTITNTDHTTGNYIGGIFDFTSSRAGLLWFDDINICKSNDGFNTFIYDNAWVGGFDPNGVSTSLDNIEITSGDASISATTNINKVVVKPGSSLTIDSGADLLVNDNMTLESVSDSYSSLILNGTISTGTINYQRFVNLFTNGDGGNDLVSAPLSGQTWSSFLSTGTNATDLLDNGQSDPTTYAFAPFDKTAMPVAAYVNYTDATSATLEKGVGHRVATDASPTEGTTLTFTGAPENGTIPVNISNSGIGFEEWNLIGNPYASYISAFDFLNHNINNNPVLDALGGAIYGYNGQAIGNIWEIHNLASVSGPGNDLLITPGQGFFVASGVPAGFIEFTTDGTPSAPDMRRRGSSDDFINGRSGPNYNLELDISTNQNNFRTDFYFNENSSLGLNPGYDAKLFGQNAPNFSIYSHLVEDNTGVAMGIQSLHSDDITDVTIPLGVNANQAEQLTFSISENTLPNGVEVYLDDIVANTSILLNNSNYVLTPTSDLSGTGRFYIRLNGDTLSTTELQLDAINIFTNNDEKTIVISGQLVKDTTVRIFDIQGRAMSQVVLSNTSNRHTIDSSSLSSGVYIVQMNNGVSTKAHKIIIK
ncbi:T9SS type A sorting domain-containing protein [Psychroserpens sp. MEBiC05023]